jgi:hypothetical protein
LRILGLLGALLLGLSLGSCKTLNERYPTTAYPGATAHVMLNLQWSKHDFRLGDNTVLWVLFERYDPATGNVVSVPEGTRGIPGFAYNRRVENLFGLHQPLYKVIPAIPGHYRLTWVHFSPSGIYGSAAIGTSYATTYAGAQRHPDMSGVLILRKGEAYDWRTISFEVREGEVLYIGDLVVEAPSNTYPFRTQVIDNFAQARASLADRPDYADRLTRRVMRPIPF